MQNTLGNKVAKKQQDVSNDLRIEFPLLLLLIMEYLYSIAAMYFEKKNPRNVAKNSV